MKFLKKKNSIIVTASVAKNYKYRKNFLNIKYIFSPKNLYNAFIELKDTTFLKNSLSIKPVWFKTTSQELINGNFKYFRSKKIQKIKQYDYKNFNILIFQNFKIQIIEKALLNNLEPIFEGLWTWNHLDLKNQKSKSIKLRYLKKKEPFIKQYVYKPKFLNSNYGFRPGKSIHFVLKKICNWDKNFVWVLNYEIYKNFTSINQNRLKNIFLSYVNEKHVWKEIKKLLNIKFLNIDNCFNNKSMHTSPLTNLLHNIYMTELDIFIQKLNKLLMLSNSKILLKIDKNYNSIIYNFYKKSKTEHLDKKFLENTHLKLKKNQLLYWNEVNKKLKTNQKNVLQYIRYKNHFLISLNSQRKLTLKIRKQIDTFIKSDLHLNLKLNQLKNQNEKYIKFLNYKIYLTNFRKKKLKTLKYWGLIYANIEKLNKKLWRINTFKIKKNLVKITKLNQFSKKQQINSLILKKLPYNLKKLNKNRLLLLLKLYYKNINNNSRLDKRNYSSKFFKLKEKFNVNLKKLELKKKLQLLQIKKPIFLKKTKQQLKHISSNNKKTIIKSSLSWLTNFCDFEKLIQIKKSKVYNYIYIISLIINTFRITKNFNKFKTFLIHLKKSYYKNLNTINNKSSITLPSILFINSIQNKFTIFKQDISNLKIFQETYQFKNKFYNKKLNKNIKF